MKISLKRAIAAAAVVGVAGLVPLVAASPVSATGSLQGAATIKSAGGAANLSSGDSSTTFTLALPAGAACPGDSSNDGYRWQTYMVPEATDPATLQFGSVGPTGISGFKAPLYTTMGSPVVNKQTADKTPPGTTGPILNVPDMSFAALEAGTVPTGVYNIGIACTLGPASATQMNYFWNTQVTVLKRASGGPAQIIWKAGNVPAAPDAPTLTSATAGAVDATTGKVSLAYAIPEAVPALTSCNVLVGTTPGGSEFSGPGGTSVGCGSSSLDVPGLAYGTPYFFRVASTNAVGSATSSELSATAIRPAVTNLVAIPGAAASINVDWADAPLLAGGEQYNIVVAGVAGTFHSSTSNISFAGAPGNTYTFTVTYGATGTSLPATTSAKAKCNKGAVSGLVSNTLPQLEAVACIVNGLGL